MGILKKLAFGNFGEKIVNNITESWLIDSKIKKLKDRTSDYIENGKNIYERSYNNTLQIIRDTENDLSKHMQFREQIAQELGDKVEQRLLRLEINRSKVKVPEIEGKTIGTIRKNQQALVKPIDEFNIFNTLTSIQDYKQAEAHLNEAIQYYEEMRREAEKLSLLQDKLKAIRKYILCEEQEIKILLKKIDELFSEIENSLSKKAIKLFAFKEKRRLNELKLIIKQIVFIIKDDFLSDNFEVKQKFIEKLDMIQKINQNLPDAPALRENNYSIILFDGKVY